MASQPLEDKNLEGELSRENATEILNEAAKNDGESWCKNILFLETVSDDIGQNPFAIISGTFCHAPYQIQPILINFTEIVRPFSSWLTLIVRKNPFSLEVMAMVKAASFNLEPLRLPRMIEEEVKKYQDLNEKIKSFE